MPDLEAKQAITEQLHRYCHGLDRFDRGLADIWHEGGTASYGGIFEGTGAGFLDWVWPVHETFEKTSHQVANILIEVDGGWLAGDINPFLPGAPPMPGA